MICVSPYCDMVVGEMDTCSFCGDHFCKQHITKSSVLFVNYCERCCDRLVALALSTAAKRILGEEKE